MAVCVSLLLYLAAIAGHFGLVLISMNWWHSQPLPRRLLKLFRPLHALAGIVVPLVFWLTYGPDLVDHWQFPASSPWGNAVAAYLLVCWLVGLGLLPFVSIYRLMRRRPAALLSNHTRTEDIAARLGYRPAGRGKYRLLCHLPGNEVFRVDFSERIYRMSRVPAAWDGLSILHVSDLHLSGSPDRVFFQQVMDLCRVEEPDLVCVTGDIVDSHSHHRWIVPVLGRLRWRIAAFAILGNHDKWHDPGLVRRRLRRIGIRPIGNSVEQLDVRGHPLLVIGNEAPWFRPAPDLAKCPEGPFRLCLSHTPDNLPWGRQNGIDLMLAGHNHGGQIRLPLIGSMFVPSRFSRRYDCGSFHEPPTLLHVSRGLAGMQPLRYNCRPEVTRIVLRSA